MARRKRAKFVESYLLTGYPTPRLEERKRSRNHRIFPAGFGSVGRSTIGALGDFHGMEPPVRQEVTGLPGRDARPSRRANTGEPANIRRALNSGRICAELYQPC